MRKGPDQDSIQVIWKQSAGPGDSLYYQIFRDSLPIATRIDTSYLDLNIIPETRYQYAISTMNDEGESQLIEAFGGGIFSFRST